MFCPEMHFLKQEGLTKCNAKSENSPIKSLFREEAIFYRISFWWKRMGLRSVYGFSQKESKRQF